MVNICRSTFDPWVVMDDEQGEAYSVDITTLEKEGYQSTYVQKYNYIRDRGWIRENKKWIDPRNGNPYKDVHTATQAQELWEIQNG